MDPSTPLSAEPTRPDLDVVVIGGGPGGSALATLVAQAGHRVALFERHDFPRFQVGESLVPSVNLVLERLGLIPAMGARGFTEKHGVQFFGPRGPTRPFYFRDVADARLHHTWQVLRSEFDALLLDNATAHGVDTRMGTQVSALLEADGRAAGVRITEPDGGRRDVSARIVVDASGRNGLVARHYGGHQPIEGLNNVSVYAHYRDVRRDAGIDAGSTLIYRLDAQSWIWFIPLRETVSIGLVTSVARLQSFGPSKEAALAAAILRCPDLCDRLTSAELATEVRSAGDRSYRASKDGGAGWLLVGDALGFIDPIYSTGLCLTMLSVDLAAAAIDAALNGRRELDFAGYSANYQAAFDQFLTLVRAYYDADFHFSVLARNPTHRQGLIDLLTGIAGTPQADEVTRTIQSFLAGRRARL